MYFNLVACAIVKNEADNLAEWIEYHRLIGIEHFYIFDNNSRDSIRPILEKYINYGVVTLLDWPFVPGQLPAYNYAAKVFGHTTNWMAFIDLDEFIFLPSGKLLPDFLSAFGDADQIMIPFMFFGSSGHLERPLGLTIENYIHRAESVDPVVKSIVRPSAVTYADTHMSLTKDRRTVNEKGERVPEKWRVEKPSGDQIRVNHYYIKSLQDWKEKISRGEVDPTRIKNLELFHKMDFKTPDNSMEPFAKAVRSRLIEMENAPLLPNGYGAWSNFSEITYMRPWLVESHRVILAIEKKIAAYKGFDQSRLKVDRGIDHAILQIWDSNYNVDVDDACVLADSQTEFELLALAIGSRTIEITPADANKGYFGEIHLLADTLGNSSRNLTLPRSENGRNYVEFFIRTRQECLCRFDLTGEDAASSRYSTSRAVRLFPGLTIGTFTLSHRSFTAKQLDISLVGITGPNVIWVCLRRFV
jgi:hypothetical protein